MQGTVQSQRAGHSAQEDHAAPVWANMLMSNDWARFKLGVLKSKVFETPSLFETVAVLQGSFRDSCCTKQLVGAAPCETFACWKVQPASATNATVTSAAAATANKRLELKVATGEVGAPGTPGRQDARSSGSAGTCQAGLACTLCVCPWLCPLRLSRRPGLAGNHGCRWGSLPSVIMQLHANSLPVIALRSSLPG